MRIKDWRKDLLTIPNMLSLFRLLLIPVYVVIYLHATTQEEHLVAGAILAVSCLTDMIDGQIARHFNMISTIGKLLDPLADKFTQFAMIICLTIKYPYVILRVFLALFVVKEILQFVALLLSFRKGKLPKGALIAGKVSTALIFLSLIAMVMIPQMSETAVNAIMIVDAAALFMAFIQYAIAYFTQGAILEEMNKDEEKDI